MPSAAVPDSMETWLSFGLHPGQKPFPCPRCDAFFSTKSNCERHLLRKHGVTHRTLRRNGALVKKGGDEGSHESAGQRTTSFYYCYIHRRVSRGNQHKMSSEH